MPNLGERPGLAHLLRPESYLVPAGPAIIGGGELVIEGAIGFEFQAAAESGQRQAWLPPRAKVTAVVPSGSPEAVTAMGLAVAPTAS